MFKKIKCNNCKHCYDETFDECPECHAQNEQLDCEFKKIQMISFGKQLALFFTGLFGFEVLGVIVSLILSVSNVASGDAILKNMLLNVICYTALFLILFAIINLDIKKVFKNFKKWQPYVAGVVCFLSILTFSMIYQIVLMESGIEILPNENQDLIDAVVKGYPLTSLIIFGIIGPVCEELTYRLGLFSFLKRISKWLAYPISIIIFALIHFSFDPSTLGNELINLPYYIFAGFALAFTYDKFGFAGSLIGHVLNNLISFIPGIAILGVII